MKDEMSLIEILNTEEGRVFDVKFNDVKVGELRETVYDQLRDESDCRFNSVIMNADKCKAFKSMKNCAISYNSMDNEVIVNIDFDNDMRGMKLYAVAMAVYNIVK